MVHVALFSCVLWMPLTPPPQRNVHVVVFALCARVLDAESFDSGVCTTPEPTPAPTASNSTDRTPTPQPTKTPKHVTRTALSFASVVAVAVSGSILIIVVTAMILYFKRKKGDLHPNHAMRYSFEGANDGLDYVSVAPSVSRACSGEEGRQVLLCDVLVTDSALLRHRALVRMIKTLSFSQHM